MLRRAVVNLERVVPAAQQLPAIIAEVPEEASLIGKPDALHEVAP
jgi:hypothetical protein